MRLAYIVSRFPSPSETFIVRELNALRDLRRFEIGLISLFPPKAQFVHPAAKQWLDGLYRPGVLASLGGMAYWMVRRPLKLARAVLETVLGTIRRPRVLVRSLVTLAVASAQARRLQGDRVTHVHAHFASYPALAAWFCSRLTGIGYSFTAHAYDLFVDQTMLAKEVREARFVVAISSYNRGFLESYGGDKTTPVRVIHCGVDPAEYSFAPRDLPAQGQIRLLCVAALQEKKGHSILLKALGEDRELAERIRLDLVGDGPLRRLLEQEVAKRGLTDRVHFHGLQTEEAVRTLLSRADIFVLPSIVAPDGQMEGLPVALVEALATGVRVVATRLSGVPELIIDGKTGFLASPGDPDSLRVALRRAVEEGEVLDREAGRQLVETEFDVRRSAEELAAQFDSLGLASGTK